jgi:hypothetical protein
MFVAVANEGDYRVMYSTDGVQWIRTAPEGTYSNGWMSVCWSPELRMFCAVSGGMSDSSAKIMTSTDGITWAKHTISIIGLMLYSVCWSPELHVFCAVGYNNANTNKTIISPDGINWTPYVVPNFDNNWNGVCWSPELFEFCAVCTS